MANSNEYMREYMARARHERRAEMIGFLGGKCAVCGDTRDLEFDHIDPGTKQFQIGGNEQYGEDVLVAELEKCQLLCPVCHAEKTVRQQGFKGVREHGTPSMYRHHGCRCTDCVDAMRACYQRSKQRTKSMPG